MYKLQQVYGKATFDKWKEEKPTDLESTKFSSDEARGNEFCVHSFQELKEVVDSLSGGQPESMNRHLRL